MALEKKYPCGPNERKVVVITEMDGPYFLHRTSDVRELERTPSRHNIPSQGL